MSVESIFIDDKLNIMRNNTCVGVLHPRGLDGTYISDIKDGFNKDVVSYLLSEYDVIKGKTSKDSIGYWHNLGAVVGESNDGGTFPFYIKNYEKCNHSGYNVMRSMYICDIINKELHISCCYGYFDLGEYILFPLQNKSQVFKYLRESFPGIVLDVFDSRKSDVIVLIK